MNRAQARVEARERIHERIRQKVEGTPERPRLAVRRTLKFIYAQLIDDLAGCTVASASSLDVSAVAKKGGNIGAAKEIGKALAERAKQAGVTTVVFDRNGFRYHGRVEAVAEGAREGGLAF